MSKKDKYKKEVEILNRKAQYEYFFRETVEAGIMLTGTEVKSVRLGNANLKDAYCVFKKDELWVNSLYIAEFKFGNINNHETRRTRKLLLRRQELNKWQRKVKEKGFTIVPFRMFLSERGLVKLEIALCQGKKSYDKRESIKQKDNKRQMDRLNKIKL